MAGALDVPEQVIARAGSQRVANAADADAAKCQEVVGAVRAVDDVALAVQQGKQPPSAPPEELTKVL